MDRMDIFASCLVLKEMLDKMKGSFHLTIVVWITAFCVLFLSVSV